MDEFSFIILTIVIVFILIFFVNRILSRKKTDKNIMHSQEKFSEKLNDLEVIINGVSKKEMTEPKEENNEKTEELSESKEITDENKKTKTNKTNNNIDLKKSVISKEILDKKKSL